MIPLNKNPGLIPIGVEKVLNRISAKVVTMMSKQDVMKAAGKNYVRGSKSDGSLCFSIQHLLDITSSSKRYSKEIAYTNDFTVVGSIKDIKCYWEHLNSFATFFGYYPKASKSHFIVKSQYLETASVVFGNTKFNLISEVM